MNALPVVEIDLGPGVRAGFTTRVGGVSRAPWDSLNLSTTTGDDPAAVAANRLAVAGWIGAPVAFATQVHGTGVLEVAGAPASPELSVGEADALVTRSPAVALGVLVADCVPVLIADPVAQVVAVAHAGRAGLVAGVLATTLAAMTARGARPDRLRVGVGPCIAGASYEVPSALRDEVEAAVPGTAAWTSWGTPAIDLVAGVRSVLGALGVRDLQVTGIDTLATPSAFSYRRDGRLTGRSAGLIRLSGAVPP